PRPDRPSAGKRMARAHAVGTPAAPAALPEGGWPAPGQAARRSATRSAACGRAGRPRAAVSPRARRAGAQRRRQPGARSVRLADRGAAGRAVRAGAAHPGAGLGEAPVQALADCAPMSVARSLLYAAANVLHPRMLWLMLWPMLVALALWGTVALLSWTRLAVRIAAWLQQGVDYALSWAHLDLAAAALVAANVLLFLLFVPLVYLTALFILSVFGMQQMVNYVAERSYPALERRRGGGVAGTGWNSLVAFFGLLGLGVLSLPFWLFPPLWPVIPLVHPAEDHQRLLRYDALPEHADAQE